MRGVKTGWRSSFPLSGIEKRMVKMEICCIIEKIYKNDWEQEFYNE